LYRTESVAQGEPSELNIASERFMGEPDGWQEAARARIVP
jgi:hypothetical protein